ncbi:MAG: hypothetical protein ACXAC7_14220 [Candidatus Hodarchaeales archaeon]|jgi:hypothetical protein
MVESNRIIEKWINGKFDSKIVISLVQREQFLNPQFSLINGREYDTKLGRAMQAQIGLNDLREIVKTIENVISEMEKRLPPPKESSEPPQEQSN